MDSVPELCIVCESGLSKDSKRGVIFLGVGV